MGWDDFPKIKEYLHVWGQRPGAHGGRGQRQNGEGKYPSAPCILLPPRGAGLPAQGQPEGREEAQHAWAGAHPPEPQPLFRGEEWAGWAQVARLSAGRPDMRIWELLLLRMESWVPPFTPLLARDGCRCLKSMVK